MSANIPFEVQAEIINRVLDVKSLVRFRSVSKQWKSLIDSSKFINHRSVNQTHPHPHHLLVKYRYGSVSNDKYVSIVDDDSFPHHKFSPHLPPTVELLTDVTMVSSSHGLVCLYGHSEELGKSLFVVWNPSIRKSVGIIFSGGYRALGFGVCPKTFDPKIVKISLTDLKWKAEVFTLSSCSWRSIPINIHMPQRYITFRNNPVAIDGIIYWVTLESEIGFVVSFDLTTEEFAKIDLQENLAHGIKSISKLKESLVVLDYCDELEGVLDVWKMIKNGDSNFSFEKLYTVKCFVDDSHEVYDIIGFRKNGQPIRIHICDDDYDTEVVKLEAYEPRTGCSSDLGIYASDESIVTITSYTESLLLLNHSESIIQE